MTKDTTEFILSSDGKILQREIREQEKILSSDALNALATGVVRHIDRVFELPELGHVNCDINQECARFSFPVPCLPLRAPYILEDGILSPSFSAIGEPVFDMQWKPPLDMKLLMVVEVYPNPRGASIADCYLPAFDKDKDNRCYCLPLGNLFDDSKICTGEFIKSHSDCQKAVLAAWEQFRKSEWNGDLDDAPDSTRSLFRFKANEKAFDQLEPSAHWATLADKISPAILNRIKV